MTIQDLKDNNLLILDVIVGSHAYGLNIETSDIDKKGIFILPQDMLYGNRYIAQISDEKNDETYYEIGRFFELLKVGNPNILELLNTSEDKILYKHPIVDEILKHKEKFITKKCKETFANYGKDQIVKSRGLNKKIVNPVGKDKKSPLDFCFVHKDYNSISLINFLNNRGLKQLYCGVSSIPNAKDLYALFYDFKAHSRFENDGYFWYYSNGEISKSEYSEGEFERFKNRCMEGGMFLDFKGIVKESENGEFISNALRMSSIPKEENKNILCYFSYNKDGYVKYCKDYKEYWSWVEKRNPIRYQDNVNHGKNYDSKNLLHCHRLLDMSIEIAQGKGINVHRDNREYLLKIRSGEMEYDKLVQDAEEKIKLSDELFEKSNLPHDVDSEFVYNLLIDIRKQFYAE